MTVLILVTTLGGGLVPRKEGAQGVVFETESLYHHIYVSDQGGIRTLRFDNAAQSGMYLDRPYESAYPYPDYLHLALTLNPDIKDVLVIGLGAGLAPKRFARDYPDVSVEVVEIDPAVVKVAREYFGFPGDDEIKVHVQDGRIYLRDAGKKYDLIMVDAYYADAIPFHLTTAEFYEVAKERLKPGGVLASNMIGALEGQRSKLFRSMYMTMTRVFPGAYVFALDNRPSTEESYRNIEVFAVAPPASQGESQPKLTRQDFAGRAEELSKSRVTIPGLVRMAGDLYEKPISREGAVLLTDDHAPVDALLHLY